MVPSCPTLISQALDSKSCSDKITKSSRSVLPTPLSAFSVATSTAAGTAIEARLSEPPPLTSMVAEAASVQPLKLAVPELLRFVLRAQGGEKMSEGGGGRQWGG